MKEGRVSINGIQLFTHDQCVKFERGIGRKRNPKRRGVGIKMPKKMGVNTKAEAARARRSAVEVERKEKETRDKEDSYWREAEGSKSRASKKKEEEAEKRAEAAVRRAEVRRLAEQEEKELDKALKKVDNKKANRVSIPVPKVTEVELRQRREEEQAAAERKAEEAKKRQSRTAAEEEYERMVLVSNTNRDGSIIEARTLDDAIAQMTIVDTLPPDRHPERRLKASFKAFEEAELPKLKEEKPGLTHTQYKDLIWKLWKKSPDNPLNQNFVARISVFSHNQVAYIVAIWAGCRVNDQLQLHSFTAMPTNLQIMVMTKPVEEGSSQRRHWSPSLCCDLIISQFISTHSLTSQIYHHLEALAGMAATLSCLRNHP
ncbi:Coiled-coil domain-containing protein 124-like protein, partial [Mucuna pruriens]